MSQEKLSERAGLGVKAIQNMENLKYDFKIQTLQKVIDALDLTVEEFFHFQFSQNTVRTETLLKNIVQLPEDKQSNIITSFNEIIKSQVENDLAFCVHTLANKIHKLLLQYD